MIDVSWFISHYISLLLMVSMLEIGRCASKDVGPQKEWIVRSHISWREKRNLPYKCMKISS